MIYISFNYPTNQAINFVDRKTMKKPNKSNKSFLFKSYRFFLGVLIFSTAAVQADEVEEVVVTGSRIQRADLEATTPVVSFGSEEIANSGITA